MAVTLADIAKSAGVSQATVSRSLNDSDLIPDKTKKRIKKIAEELGFEFNANARSLITSKTGTIGIIYPNNSADFSYNLHFTSWHNELRDQLEKENLDIIISYFENKYTGQNNIRKLISGKKVDGLIIIQPVFDIETLELLKRSNKPFVFLKYVPDIDGAEKDIDVVYIDHFQGGYLAAEHLIKLGHRNIMSISADIRGGEFNLRSEGYKAALNNHGIAFDEKKLVFGDTSFNSGYQIAIDHIDTIKNTTAIFSQNDLMALGAIRALKELKIRVPEDIAVVGYDNIEFATYYKPYLTTIHQPTKEIAMLTCERLVSLLNNKESSVRRRIVLQPKLIVRESCGAPEQIKVTV